MQINLRPFKICSSWQKIWAVQNWWGALWTIFWRGGMIIESEATTARNILYCISDFDIFIFSNGLSSGWIYFYYISVLWVRSNYYHNCSETFDYNKNTLNRKPRMFHQIQSLYDQLSRTWVSWLIYSCAICRVSYLDSWVSGPSPGKTFLSLSKPWFKRSILLLSRALAASLLFFMTLSGRSERSAVFLVLLGLPSVLLSRLSDFLFLRAGPVVRSTGWWSEKV